MHGLQITPYYCSNISTFRILHVKNNAKSPWQRSVLFWCQDQPDSHNSLLGEGAQERDTLFGFGHIPRIDSGRYKQINDLGRGENCEFCLY